MTANENATPSPAAPLGWVLPTQEVRSLFIGFPQTVRCCQWLRTVLKHCTSIAKGNATLVEDAGFDGARERDRRSVRIAGKAFHILPWKVARQPGSGTAYGHRGKQEAHSVAGRDRMRVRAKGLKKNTQDGKH